MKRLSILSAILILLLFVSLTAQVIHPVPPDVPALNAVPGDNKVTLYWGPETENHVDSVRQMLYPDPKYPEKWNDFEGYRLYKSERHDFEDAFEITDVYGNPVFYKPIAVFDKINSHKDLFTGNFGVKIPLILKDNSENPMAESLPPFFPDIKPYQPFATLLGENINGKWILSIRDNFADSKIGVIWNWKMNLNDTTYTGSINHIEVQTNGSFEEWDMFRPSYWEAVDTNAHYFKTDSALFVTDGEYAAQVLLRNQNVATALDTIEVYQRISSLVKGSTYTLSADLYLDSNLTVDIGFRQYYAVATGLSQSTSQEMSPRRFTASASGGQKFRYTQNITLHQSYLFGEFFIRMISNDTVSVYVDNVRIRGNRYFGDEFITDILDTLDISATGSLTSLDMILDMEHDWVYMLDLSLKSPSGTVIDLFKGEKVPSIYGEGGVTYYLGNNSGLQYSYEDEDVVNGKRYFYALTTFDSGDTLYNIFPAESGFSSEFDPLTGELDMSKNVVTVVPSAKAAAYEPAKMEGGGSLLNHTSGPGTSILSLEILDPSKVTDKNLYKVIFRDTRNTDIVDPSIQAYHRVIPYTWDYSLLNTTTGDTLIKNSKTFNTITSVVEGFRLNMRNVGSVTIWNEQNEWLAVDSFKRPDLVFSTTPNFSGRPYPTDYEVTFYPEVVDTSLEFVSTFDRLDPLPINYKVKDLVNGRDVKTGFSRIANTYNNFIIYFFYEDTVNYSGTNIYRPTWSVKMESQGKNVISLQNEQLGGRGYWTGEEALVQTDAAISGRPPTILGTRALRMTNVKTYSNDPVYYWRRYNLEPGYYRSHFLVKTNNDEDVNLAFITKSGSLNKTIHIQPNPAWQEIYIDSLFLTNEDSLALVWYPETTDSTTLTISYIVVLNFYPISSGDQLIVRTKKPFRQEDIFEFSLEQAYVNADSVKSELEKVKVVPNPFGIASLYTFSDEYGGYQDGIRFIHVPVNSKIRIYSVNGSFIKELVHNGSIEDGSVFWDLKNKDGQMIAYGVYIYYLDAGSLGTKTGKFAIIR
jgi:hypothetical protein